MTEAEAVAELSKAGKVMDVARDTLLAIAKTEEIFANPIAPAEALRPYAIANAKLAQAAISEIVKILSAKVS